MFQRENLMKFGVPRNTWILSFFYYLDRKTHFIFFSLFLAWITTPEFAPRNSRLPGSLQIKQRAPSNYIKIAGFASMNLAHKIPKSLLKTLHSTASKPTRHLHPCGTPSSPDSDSGGEKIPALISLKVDTFRFNKVRYNLFNGNSSSGGSTFYRSSGARNNFLCPWTLQ